MEGNKMTRLTQDQVDMHMARMARLRVTQPQEGAPEEPDRRESVLQNKITRWAQEWGHPCWCRPARKNAKGFMPAGWPD